MASSFRIFSQKCVHLLGFRLRCAGVHTQAAHEAKEEGCKWYNLVETQAQVAPAQAQEAPPAEAEECSWYNIICKINNRKKLLDSN